MACWLRLQSRARRFLRQHPPDLSADVKPVIGAGCVVRLTSTNHMGIHLGRLAFEESQRLQEFLLPLIPVQ
jgi:hypothetical protein